MAGFTSGDVIQLTVGQLGIISISTEGKHYATVGSFRAAATLLDGGLNADRHVRGLLQPESKLQPVRAA